MARVPRSSLPDGYFHVFVHASGTIFRDDEDRETFMDLVWRTARRHGWTCYALCVLGSHYHLVLETTRPALSSGVRRLNWTYAVYFNTKYGAVGHIFADRFGARAIEGDEYLHDACSYVLLNPVRAGLCERVEDWPWSYCSFGLHAA
jgi:putative transposase